MKHYQEGIFFRLTMDLPLTKESSGKAVLSPTNSPARLGPEMPLSYISSVNC